MLARRRALLPALPLFRTPCADVVGSGVQGVTRRRGATQAHLEPDADPAPAPRWESPAGGATYYVVGRTDERRNGVPRLRAACALVSAVALVWGARPEACGSPFCGTSLRISASMPVVDLALLCSLLIQVSDVTILRRVDASAGWLSVRGAFGALLMIRVGLLVVLFVALSRTRLERHPR